MKHFFYLFFLGFVCWCNVSSQTLENNVYKQIIKNIVHQETIDNNVQKTDQHTAAYLKLIEPNGSFNDIDYTSHSQTAWEPINHVTRLREMCVSYITPGSSFYANDKLYNHIVNMVSYWYECNPTSTNWWYHEIGWAQPIGLSLTLMRAGKKNIPQSLESKMLKRMRDISKGPDQKGSQGTGANKMDIALQWLYRTLLQEDYEGLKFSIDQFYYPIQYNLGQGIQQDYSYLQHGMQLYTAGYGQSVLTAFLKVAYYVKGTDLEQADKTDIISKFVRYGYLPGIRGTLTMYNLRGRGISHIEKSKGPNSLYKDISRFSILDPKHKETYAYAIKRLKGEAPANYGIHPFHRHYWRSDHTIHQRPSYSMDVRLASTRTARCENGNRENLKGYFLTEGGTEIVRRGDEYMRIFTAWDWSRIPGTTTPIVDTIPNPGSWEHNGQSQFAGGVTDNKYGVTAYDLVDNQFDINTHARKSWFFFDKEVVCMGSGIHSTNCHPINTTVNQCNLNGEVKITTNKGAESVQTRGHQNYTDVRWVTHDSISYYFPEGGKLNIRNDVQTAIPYDICNTLSHEETSADVFKMWFDHGIRPTHGSYIYYVMPDVTSAKEGKKEMDHLSYVNNDSIQAVYNHDLKILGVVFYKKGSLKIKNIKVESTTPCIVMFKGIKTSTIETYISDPSCQLKSTTLTVRFPKIRKDTTLTCDYNQSAHYAGSTHHFTIR